MNYANAGLGPLCPSHNCAPREMQAGLSAAESLDDAKQKIGSAHSAAVGASSVADWTSVAQLARDGAAEVSDVSVGTPAAGSISQWASDADLALHQIIDNPSVSDNDAQVAGLRALASADAALLEATTQPVPAPPAPGPTPRPTPSSAPASGMSGTQKAAVAVAIVAAGVVGYYGWRWLKHSGRRGRR